MFFDAIVQMSNGVANVKSNKISTYNFTNTVALVARSCMGDGALFYFIFILFIFYFILEHLGT